MKPLTIYHLCLLAFSVGAWSCDQDGPVSAWICLVAANATLAALNCRYYRDEV